MPKSKKAKSSNFGMNSIKEIKEHKDWKNLPVAIGPDAPSRFELIAFEELDDYSLEDIPLEDRFDSSDEEARGNKNVEPLSTDNGEKSKKKRKKKRNRKKNKNNKSSENKTTDKVEAGEEKQDNLEPEDIVETTEISDDKVVEGTTEDAEEKTEDVEETTEDVEGTTEDVEETTEVDEENDQNKKSIEIDEIKEETDNNEADAEKIEENIEEIDLDISSSMEIDISIEELAENKSEDMKNNKDSDVVLEESKIVATKRKNDEDEERKSKKLKKFDESRIISQMDKWNQFELPIPILQALLDQGFKTPMPIQEKVLPVAIQQRKDILGAAETGSGKTLAFGIPLICHLIEDKARNIISKYTEEENESGEFQADKEEDLLEDFDDEELDKTEKSCRLPALILTPTRELAIQVKNHLVKMTKYVQISIVVVVGDMSIQKQQRLLAKQPEIVIATPGRLWELMNSGDEPHLARLQTLRYLVIDEADRMFERGHFEDLNKIFKVINAPDCYKKRQNFLFSATLTTIRDVSTRVKKQAGYQKETREKKLEQLSKRLVGNRKPYVVDLTTRKLTAEKLREARIFCGNDEKDFYLYYFIKSNPGRTLVFVNSIASVFRLHGVFEALKCSPITYHGKKQQSLRLKNLDRFRDNPNAVMIASDVAARGLDITDVKHVIHYHVPRTLETFVHRSGRSARSGKDGLSLLLVSPEELTNYKKICRASNKPNGIEDFPVDQSVMGKVKERVRMARELDQITHRSKKTRDSDDWFTKMAKEADMIVDEELIRGNKKETKEKQHLIKMKKQHLEKVLKQPIFPRGFSKNFITKTGSLQQPLHQFAHK